MVLIKIPAPRIRLPDFETHIGVSTAKHHGRSWWALVYRDGKIIHEWDPDTGSPNGHADWPRLPINGRQALRLYCPNGKLAELGSVGTDNTGRLFQFKVAAVIIGGPVGRDVLAHVIGMVTGPNGECALYVWEPLPPPEIPSDAPSAPSQQEWVAKSAAPGLYEKAVVDWERALAEYEHTPQYKSWAQRHVAWQGNAGGHLFGPIEDNVYDIKYRQIGRLNADVLGIDDGEGR